MTDEDPNSTAARRDAQIRAAEAETQAAAEQALRELLAVTLDALGDNLDTVPLEARMPAWREILARTIMPAVDAALGRGWREALDNADWSADPYVTEYLNDVNNRLVDTADYVFDVIRDEIDEGRRAGESIPDLTKRIQNVLDYSASPRWKHRAVMIARTETIGAYNAGHHASTTELALALDFDLDEIAKEWLETHDTRTRPTHSHKPVGVGHAVVVGMTTPFIVGGSPMQRPGDPAGPAGEVINCRCTILYHFPGDPDYPALTASTTPEEGSTMTITDAVVQQMQALAVDPDDCNCADEDWGTAQQREDCGCDEDPNPEDDFDLLYPKGQPIPWHGVLAPEGIMSGDRRKFAEGSLRHRDLPLPLAWQEANNMGHDGAVVVARIDTIEAIDGLQWGDGVFDLDDESRAVARKIHNGFLRGVSVDVDDVTAEVQTEDGDPYQDPFMMLLMGDEDEDVDLDELEDQGEPVFVVTDGRIAGATLCAIPAFQEAFVTLGKRPENPTIPASITEAKKAMSAADLAKRAKDSAPAFRDCACSLTAAAPPQPMGDYANPMFEGPTPQTILKSGQIFGHLALWGTCHTSFTDRCVMAPKSRTGYAHFLTGEVETDGGMIPVGHITLGTGHAPDLATMPVALAHYDNTGTVVADINVGEDQWGIWFAGRLRDDITDADLHALRAAPPSGDWRRTYGGSQELIAALSVNVPGFLVPRVKVGVQGGRQVSLVAAGALPPRRRAEDAVIGKMLTMSAAREVIAILDRRDRVEAAARRIGRDKASRRAAAIAAIERTD